MSLRRSYFTTADAGLVFLLALFRLFNILLDLFWLSIGVDQLLKLAYLRPPLCLKVLGGLRAGLLSRLLFFLVLY
jgi:hypothetical protein